MYNFTRWKGSVYKFIWMDFVVFAVLYYTINFVYRSLLDDDWKRCECKFNELVL